MAQSVPHHSHQRVCTSVIPRATPRRRRWVPDCEKLGLTGSSIRASGARVAFASHSSIRTVPPTRRRGGISTITGMGFASISSAMRVRGRCFA